MATTINGRVVGSNIEGAQEGRLVRMEFADHGLNIRGGPPGSIYGSIDGKFDISWQEVTDVRYEDAGRRGLSPFKSLIGAAAKRLYVFVEWGTDNLLIVDPVNTRTRKVRDAVMSAQPKLKAR
jgi:hypothetical protein